MPSNTPGPQLPSIQSVTDSQWAILASRRVFFGHQSVGGNIMEGVSEVLAANPGIPLRVAESRTASQPGFFHAAVGRNDYPLEKFKDFASVASDAFRSQGDVAMVKLCYVDIHRQTDANALFAEYQRTVAEVKARNPAVTIVHVTTPITVNENWKGLLMAKVRGYSTQRERNLVRHRYNELMRQTYGNTEPLFDLALLESRYPDGRPSRYSIAGESVPLMVPAYTSDGSHLNETGRRMAAEQLLILLANLPTRPAQVAAQPPR